jgi:V/A-type H+/Na+-transporting ATPase subunit D
MALKFQYNKVEMQRLQKELKIRVNALPTLKSKEAYLRVVIKRQKQQLSELETQLDQKRLENTKNERLWSEFSDTLVRISQVKLLTGIVAGVKVPELKDIEYAVEPVSPFLRPSWFLWGVKTAMELERMVVEISIAKKGIGLLEYARKKTTQKVNLYEKVQIPGYDEAILKIKRYLEDVENLSKASQKITKNRQIEGVPA